jgi:hypothetical protein
VLVSIRNKKNIECLVLFTGISSPTIGLLDVAIQCQFIQALIEIDKDCIKRCLERPPSPEALHRMGQLFLHIYYYLPSLPDDQKLILLDAALKVCIHYRPCSSVKGLALEKFLAALALSLTKDQLQQYFLHWVREIADKKAPISEDEACVFLQCSQFFYADLKAPANASAAKLESKRFITAEFLAEHSKPYLKALQKLWLSTRAYSPYGCDTIDVHTGIILGHINLHFGRLVSFPAKAVEASRLRKELYDATLSFCQEGFSKKNDGLFDLATFLFLAHFSKDDLWCEGGIKHRAQDLLLFAKIFGELHSKRAKESRERLFPIYKTRDKEFLSHWTPEEAVVVAAFFASK